MSLASLPPGTNLNYVPAGVKPDGSVEFNLFSGQSLSTTTIVIFCVLMPTAVMTVGFRLLSGHKTRANKVGGIGWADLASVLALVFSIAQEGIVLSLHRYQRHQWDVSVGSLNDSYFKRIYAQDIIAWPAIFLAKLAILLLYLRIFQVQKGMRVAIYVGIVWALLTYAPNIAVTSYFCAAHVDQAWDFSVGMHCSNRNATKWLVCSAAMSVALDIYILLLPVPVVRGLNMSSRRRFGVLLIFFTAFFAVVCAALTLVYRIRLMTSSSDDLWVSSQLFICNLVENFIAIIVGAMPGCSTFLKAFVANSPFFSQLSSRFSFSRSSRSATGTGGSASRSGGWKGSKGSYKLREVSADDTESQRSLARAEYPTAAKNIKVKTSYEVDYSQP